jgi:hypothetical protein
MDYSLFVTDWQPKHGQMGLESLGLLITHEEAQ